MSSKAGDNNFKEDKISSQYNYYKLKQFQKHFSCHPVIILRFGIFFVKSR